MPGNDNTHACVNGLAAAALIEGSTLYRLPIEDLAVPLLPFTQWAPHEETLAGVFADFMNNVVEKRRSTDTGASIIEGNTS